MSRNRWDFMKPSDWIPASRKQGTTNRLPQLPQMDFGFPTPLQKKYLGLSFGMRDEFFSNLIRDANTDPCAGLGVPSSTRWPFKSFTARSRGSVKESMIAKLPTASGETDSDPLAPIFVALVFDLDVLRCPHDHVDRIQESCVLLIGERKRRYVRVAS